MFFYSKLSCNINLTNCASGVDPAGPGFTVPWDFGVGTRLMKTDAHYVQCIHTADGTLGTHKDCGHADFYLNGGFLQPGCFTLMCSHSRAHDYFSEAIVPNHTLVGVKCRGSLVNLVWKLFGGQCSTETDRLGIHSERKAGRFYLRTNRQPPYGMPMIAGSST